jgi:hypothetical protein
MASAIGPVVEQLGTEFVAENDLLTKVEVRPETIASTPQFHHTRQVLQRVKIRAADAATESFDQHLAGPRTGIVHFLALQNTVQRNNCTHQILLSDHQISGLIHWDDRRRRKRSSVASLPDQCPARSERRLVTVRDITYTYFY